MNSTVGGRAHIEELSAITIGAVVHDRLTIGSSVLVGSGCVVTKNLEDFAVTYGSPARVVRKRSACEAYLK